MFDEIGSEFWIDPSALISRKTGDSAISLPTFFFEGQKPLFTATGRSAITCLLRHINPASKSVFLPDYTCDTVIRPFVTENYHLHFYRVNESLQDAPEEWLENFYRFKPGVVLLHPYFGFDTIRLLRLFYKEIQDNGSIIIEDATHSLLSSFTLESRPDYYVGSLRKWLALPDGGFVLSCNDNNSNLPTILPPDLFYTRCRCHAMVLKRHYIQDGSHWKKERFLDLFAQADGHLEQKSEVFGMSEISRTIFRETNWEELILLRRKNYRFLHDALTPYATWLRPVFSTLPDDVCPLFMPIWVSENHRNILKDFLVGNHIYTPVHWPFSSLIPQGHENSIYHHCLSIPCDQRYNEESLSRVLETIDRYTSIYCGHRLIS